MSTNDLKIAAVGIDVGSLNARVAVVASSEAKVVSNTLGHRSTVACVVKEEDSHVVMGEAAKRLLHKQKKTVKEHTVHHYLLDQDNDDDLCSLFMGHLCSLASDATSISPSQLRLTLSVPVDASEEFFESLVERTKRGIKTLIKQQQGSNKKKIKNNIVVGVLTDAAAICVAHGLTDKQQSSSIGSKRKTLVIDWGASGVTTTSLEFLGSSRILSIMSSKRETSLSGSVFAEVFARHVASQFERKNRLSSGEVWENFKARTKLLGECEAALKTMTNSGGSGSSGNSSSVHVTIDGLYEGIDCHIGVSRPRWDMLTSALLSKAQKLLEEIASSVEPEIVLLAGSVGLLPSVQQLVDKVFSPNDVYRGLSNIPPDEAVALGCACHAAHAVDFMDASDRSAPVVPLLSDVPTSPIALGLRTGCNEGDDDNTVTLIRQGTPLPAHVAHNFVCEIGETYALWQLTPTNKMVAKLEDLPASGKEVELLVELSTKGSLSLALQGGALVRI